MNNLPPGVQLMNLSDLEQAIPKQQKVKRKRKGRRESRWWT